MVDAGSLALAPEGTSREQPASERVEELEPTRSAWESGWVSRSSEFVDRLGLLNLPPPG